MTGNYEPIIEVELKTARRITATIMFALAALFAVAAVCSMAQGQTTQPTTRPAPAFIIGTWHQPASSLPLWKLRGINTVIGTIVGPGQDSPTDADYVAKAHALGLYVIAPCNEADAHEQVDEPDGASNVSPAAIVAQYKAWKSIDARNVLLNVDGWKTQYRAASDYIAYFKGADWIGFDYYVLNRGEGPDAIAKLGERCDAIKLWSGNKRIFACIECSDQDLRITDWANTPDASGTPAAGRMRGPTPDEMEREIRVCVAHGATGIIYFPDVIGKGWESFDGTTPELAARMMIVNASLTGSPAPVITPAVKPVGPLDGKTVTVDGFDYFLNAKH